MKESAMSDSSAPLEVQLVAALRAGDAANARQIAAALHERGFAVATLEQALAPYPHLEEALWKVMSAVIPVSRREQKRRAIRAAEERDWGDWNEGKRGSR
jgi:hypothetical protein